MLVDEANERETHILITDIRHTLSDTVADSQHHITN